MTSPFHGTPYPLRVLVLAVDGHAHEAVARYAASMARSLARERDTVYLAITPAGWCTPFTSDEPMQFVAWQAPPSDMDEPPSRRAERKRTLAAEVTRTLVRSVQPECVLFVTGYAGHGMAMLEGVAASGVPAAVVVLDAHDPHAAAEARPMFARHKACAQAWVATTAHAQRVLARRLGCTPSALEVCPEGTPVHPHAAPDAIRSIRDTVNAALGLPPDATLVVSRGRMSEDSGCLDFAEAVAAVSGGHPNARFVWLGHGPLQNSMENALRHTPRPAACSSCAKASRPRASSLPPTSPSIPRGSRGPASPSAAR